MQALNSIFLIIALAVLGTPLSQASDAEPINTDPLIVHGIDIPNYEPGTRVDLKINFELPSGYHAYVEQFHIEAESPSYVYVSEPQVEPQVNFKDPVTKKTKKGVAGRGSLTAILQISKDEFAKNENLKGLASLPLNLIFTYQACTKTYCLFPTRKLLKSEITFKDAGYAKDGRSESSSTDSNANTNLVGAEPSKLSDDLDANVDPSNLQNSFEKALNTSLSLAFLIVFLAGILTSFTPCIFPMIPITLAVLGIQNLNENKPRSKLNGFFISSAYVFGIAITYALLGVIAAQTGALFGSLLGHPVVVLCIALVFVLMGLSMLGYFEVKLPDFIAHRFAQKLQSNSSGSYSSAFLAGLFAGIVASPCVGPVLVSILTFVARSQDLVLGFFLLFVFALGLGQIFLVLGTFSQLVKKLPRSGPWLNRTKFIFAFILFFMAGYYVVPVWPQLKRIAVSVVGGDSNRIDGISKSASSPSAEQGYLRPEWILFSEENLLKAKNAGLPVIIDFKAEWCAACFELEEKTFSHKEVHEFGKQFVWLYFDATSSSPELDRLKKKYGILGLPFVTFHSPSGEWLSDLTLTGFEGPDLFIKRMQKATQK